MSQIAVGLRQQQHQVTTSRAQEPHALPFMRANRLYIAQLHRALLRAHQLLSDAHPHMLPARRDTVRPAARAAGASGSSGGSSHELRGTALPRAVKDHHRWARRRRMVVTLASITGRSAWPRR